MSNPIVKSSSRKPARGSKGGASKAAAGLRATTLGSPQVEVIKATAEVVPIAWIIKFGLILGVAWFLWYRYNNRFISMKYRSDLDAANISEGEAQARASAIYGSIGWFSNDYSVVQNAISGLNYNGFVRLYNAFGHHTGTLLGGELDLIAWCKNQFTDTEVSKLRFIMGGAFF